MPVERTGSRTTSTAVTFTHPFRIGNDPRELPAGVYMLHTQEDISRGAFEPVYVATSVDLVVEESWGTSTRIVRPSDLEAALARDLAQLHLVDGMSENPDRGKVRSCDARAETAAP